MSQARRRQFLITAGALLAAALTASAQQAAASVARIGFLGVSTPAAWTTRVDALRAGLRDLGYVEGRNIVNVRGPADLDIAFAAMAKENVDALAVVEDIVLIQNHKRIAASAVRQRLPSISLLEYAEGRQGAWHDDAAIDPAARGPRDRVSEPRTVADAHPAALDVA